MTTRVHGHGCAHCESVEHDGVAAALFSAAPFCMIARLAHNAAATAVVRLLLRRRLRRLGQANAGAPETVARGGAGAAVTRSSGL